MKNCVPSRTNTSTITARLPDASISIITIVYNDAAHIEQTVRSVLEQSHTVDEYLIIDGASTDGTLEKLRAFEPFVRVISEPDEGICDAFNKGIKLSSGEIIGLVNSGDFLEPEALEKVAETLKRHDVEVVYGDVRYWNAQSAEYRYQADHTLLDRFMSLNHPAVFVRRSLYERLGTFDDRYALAMDYDLMLRFYLAGATFVYVPRVLSNMSLGGRSDVEWREAYREAYVIRTRQMGYRVQRFIAYRLQVFKRYGSRTLTALKLDAIVAWYRAHCASVAKRR